ncbi:MAG TPA: hypothetical protein DCK98_11080 [Chloroflexi bacterium]|nr:hypothetical protein [Chloroflexota bacterium]HAL26643.1 hypothetical protein [Chloroflexota bacterium]
MRWGATRAFHPEAHVVCALGDGALGMVRAELETAVRRALPVSIVVLVHGAVTEIKLGQERKGLPPTDTTFGQSTIPRWQERLHPLGPFDGRARPTGSGTVPLRTSGGRTAPRRGARGRSIGSAL